MEAPDAADRLQFQGEALAEVLVLRELRSDDLHRDRASRTVAQVHDTHRALPQSADQSETPDRRRVARSERLQHLCPRTVLTWLDESEVISGSVH